MIKNVLTGIGIPNSTQRARQMFSFLFIYKMDIPLLSGTMF